MLDFDLATLYEVETKALKQAVKRNYYRFPSDFMFELSKNEWDFLRCNFGTSNKINAVNLNDSKETLRSHFVTSNRGGTRYMPFAFTEQGVAMLSSILKSKKAVEVNISIMRAFVYVRQYALSHKDLTEKLKELENKYNKQFKDVYEALNYLLNKDKLQVEQNDRKRIGFKKE